MTVPSKIPTALSKQAAEEAIAEKLQELDQRLSHYNGVLAFSCLASVGSLILAAWLGGCAWLLVVVWWFYGALALTTKDRAKQTRRQRDLISGAASSHGRALDILTNRRFGLLARSFYTESSYPTSSGGHYLVEIDHWHQHPTVDLLQAIQQHVPLVGLANVDNVYGGSPLAKLWCDEDWETTFAACLAEADLVILFFTSSTDGVQKEIGLLDASGAWSKTLLMTWEKDAEDEEIETLRSKARWSAVIPQPTMEWGSMTQPSIDLSQIEELVASLGSSEDLGHS